MQLGSLELQIFVALVLVLGSAFVALVCDFLKGNNEQLRERNIELRVRDDERARLGLFEPLAHPITWLQGLAALVRNPGVAEAVAGPAQYAAPAAPAAAAPSPVASPASVSPAAASPMEQPDLGNLTGAAAASSESEADRNPQRRHRYDEFKAAAKHQSWATKDELEQLAGRAARIRSRHEASQRKQEESVLGMGTVNPAKPLEATAQVAAPSEVRESVVRPKVTELPRLELAKPVMVPAPLEVVPEPAAAEVVEPEIAVVAEPIVATVEPEAVAVEPVVSPVATMVEPVAGPVEVAVIQPLEELPVIEPVASQPIEEAVVETPAPWVFHTAVDKPAQAVAEIELAPAMPVLSQDIIEPAVMLAEPVLEVAPAAPVDEEPFVDIWLQAEQPVEAVAVPAPEAAAPPAPVVHEEWEPVRSRILAVDVPMRDEAVTEDIPVPAVQETALVFPQPEILVPHVQSRGLEVTQPAMDVAALQKATGESTNEGKLEIPAGLHESAVLSQLIENQSPFSGVVVAIGLNDYDTLREKLASGADSVAALNKMVLSMLRPQDFACRFQDDEYILVYPGERGSSAQRRLFQVSEKLWDFQLRSLGNLSVMFSWGGLEITNETLSEAVASARERMYQTKRNRKPSGLEFAAGRKKVVNG